MESCREAQVMSSPHNDYDYDDLMSLLRAKKMAAVSASPVSQQLSSMLAHEHENEHKSKHQPHQTLLHTKKMAAAVSASPVSQQLSAMLAHEHESNHKQDHQNTVRVLASEAPVDQDVITLINHIKAAQDTAQASIVSCYQQHKHILEQNCLADKENLQSQYQHQQDNLKDTLAKKQYQLQHQTAACDRLVATLHRNQAQRSRWWRGDYCALRIFTAWRRYSSQQHTKLHFSRLALRHRAKTLARKVLHSWHSHYITSYSHTVIQSNKNDMAII